MSIKLTSFCLCAVLVTPGAQGACLKYAPAKIALTGTVSPTMFYGAPGFGEYPKRDQKEVYPVLKLDSLVEICGNQHADFGSDAPQRIASMQMLFHEAPYGKQWNGKRVTVTGTLFSAQTGHHHTPVLIDVGDVHMAGSRS